MPDDDNWREWINHLDVEDLPEDGVASPDIEKTPKKRVRGVKGPKQKYMLQKLVSEVYIFTDVDNHIFGQHTFQETYILGEVSGEQLQRILEKEARKKQRDSE